MKNKNYDYEKVVQMNHNEIAAKINLETGELIELKHRRNNIPASKQVFEPDGLFKKSYINGWSFLRRELKPLELNAAFCMALMAEINTNSLKPMHDTTPVREVAELLNLNKNQVRNVLNRLFDLGVFGQFTVKERNKPYTLYWVMNPYLSFSGRLIDSDIVELFKNTHLTAAFHDPNYVMNDDFVPNRDKSVPNRDKRVI